MSVCGHPSFLRLLSLAVKSMYHKNRPFICVVIEEGGNASVHSNMDVPAERVKLMHLTLDHCQRMSTGLILPFKVD
jgi:hypothetical protein